MILSKEVEISIVNNTKSFFLKKGYDVSDKNIKVKVEDLPLNSRILVTVKCDICGHIKENSYSNYNKSLKNGNIYSCSSKCSNIKKKQTNINNFGVEWVSQLSTVKEKIKETNLERHGSLNGITGEISEKIKKDNLKKLGVESIFQLEEVKNKIKETNLEKWGYEHPMKSKLVKDKVKKTNLEKYGVDNPLKLLSIHNKSKKTKLEKYGDENFNNRNKQKLTNTEKYGHVSYTSTNEYKEKVKKTNLEKWGKEWSSQSNIIKDKVKKTKFNKYGYEGYNNIEKTKKTNLEKYGVEYILKSDEIRNKIISTNLEKYGVKSTLSLDYIKDLRLSSFLSKNKNSITEKYSNLLKKDYKITNYDSGNFIINHNDHEFIISVKLLYDRLKHDDCEICTICKPINSSESSHELNLSNWLEEFIEIERKNKKILNGQELDIYIPSKKVAIEFNGLYWHSELFKSKTYHLNKTNKCLENDIDLLHIFEDDWVNKKEIVKSIILNKIGYLTNKLWARKCKIKDVSLQEAKYFLIKNHIQGYARCKYKIGLYYENELVSLMTFGERKTNSKTEFELIRFCNKVNTNIIGSASKIFNFFIKNYNYTGTIVSYADISLFNGSIYERLGFKLVHITKPNYYWVVSGVRYHRFKFNKKKLVNKLGFDNNKTEVQIMNEMGSYKIWSCGQKRYEYLYGCSNLTHK